MKKRILSIGLILTLTLGLIGCSLNEAGKGASEADDLPRNVIDDNYRTTYEVFVYSFCDSNGDRIGDLPGLTGKLDYISDLGFNAIWLMPIMPSPSYHKYDVTDYKDIDPDYGTLEDFSALIEACHEKGIDVYIDFVMNHTSSEHPWFKEAVKYLQTLEGEELVIDEAACPYAGYYNFTTEKKDGFEPVPGCGNKFYYECRFWGGMPDVNLDNEKVQQEFKDIAAFWYDLGVDGFRMDAVTSYYTEDMGASVDALKWFADYVHGLNPELYIVTEAWTGADTYDKYLASGIDSTFEFEFSQAEGYIAKALNTGKASTFAKHLAPSVEGLRQYNAAAIPAPFYTNHDTARTGGYYTGENALAKEKMGWAMSLTMTGNSFLYYGEELGMRGSGDDENKRQAFLWSVDQSAEGMATALKATKKLDNTGKDLPTQQADENSVYNFIKKVTMLRNSSPVITHGSYKWLEDISTDSCCVIEKEYEGEKLYLLYNVGSEAAEIDLSQKVPEAKLYFACTTDENEATLVEGKVSVPGYSLVVIE